MNPSSVAHLRVAAPITVMRNVHVWLGQHAHALIMKRAMGNVTLGLWGHSKQPATKIGRQLLHALAQDQSQASTEGKPDPDAN